MRLDSIKILAAAYLLMVPSFALADAAAAKQYIATAKTKIDAGELEDAGTQLELAETEAEDAGAEKDAITAEIKSLRGKMVSAQAAADKPKYVRQLGRVMDDAEGAIGNLVTWPGAERAANELFADPAAQAALGGDLTAAQKKFATYKKLHGKKAAVEMSAQVEQAVKEAEDAWKEAKPKFAAADASPGSKESAITDVSRAIDSAREQVKTLPADDAATAAFSARLDKIGADFTQVAMADKAKEVATRLKENMELYTNDFEGWEKEPAAPTWDEFRKTHSEAMSRLNAPKTREYFSRSTDFLSRLPDNEDYKLVESAPDVQAVVKQVQADHDKAYQSLLGRAKSVVASALAGGQDTSDLSYLRDSVSALLGDEDAEGKAMQDQLQKKIAGVESATANAESAKSEMIAKLREKASEVWPQLHEGIDASGEIDLNKEGQVISFESDNLMGYRFKPGDYYFATTLGGEPVAGKIDPALLKGIKATEEVVGRSLGDDDNDGRWECIAVVTGKKVKLQARKEAETTGSVGGSDVRITTESYEPVEATVIEIIAAKCGPFAGAKGKGVLKPDGTVGAP